MRPPFGGNPLEFGDEILCEAWNGGFNATVSYPRPSFWVDVEALQQDASTATGQAHEALHCAAAQTLNCGELRDTLGQYVHETSTVASN